MIVRLALVILALLSASAWIPGIEVENFYFALIAAILLGLANITIKPILTILTLPVHLVTFGLSALVVNAGVFWLISTFVEGFYVDGFLPALLGSFVVSVASSIASFID